MRSWNTRVCVVKLPNRKRNYTCYQLMLNMQNQRIATIHDTRYRNSIQILVLARKSAKLSQSDLAQKVGLSQPDISKIERLERRLDLTEFLDILYAITVGDRSSFNQIWKEINECHGRREKS